MPLAPCEEMERCDRSVEHLLREKGYMRQAVMRIPGKDSENKYPTRAENATDLCHHTGHVFLSAAAGEFMKKAEAIQAVE